jgi:hypothetical protein
MSRRRSSIKGQWAWRTIAMLESPAYAVLSLSGRRILDRVEIELAHHGGNDNGRLPVTYEQFTEYGIERHSIAPGSSANFLACSLATAAATVSEAWHGSEGQGPGLRYRSIRLCRGVAPAYGLLPASASHLTLHRRHI